MRVCYLKKSVSLRKLAIYLCLILLPNLALPETGIAQQAFSYSSFAPQYRVQAPFGYGTVRQTMVTAAGPTGYKICNLLWGTAWKCISVSGGNTCGGQAPVGELVSCNPASTPNVDEAAFQPQTNCQGNVTGPIGNLGSGDWCEIADLQSTLKIDTLYLYDDYVRIGLNRRFGGTVFELYGVDKKNRIMENGGGALQLSLWGIGTTIPSSGSVSAYFVQPTNSNQCISTPFLTLAECQEAAGPGGQCAGGFNSTNVSNCVTQMACAGNDANAGSPVNPIQAISAGCSYGSTQWSNDEARVDQAFSPQPNVVVLTKHGPQQFLKNTNDQVADLYWSEVAHVEGPLALLSYYIDYTGNKPWSKQEQEIPALFLNNGFDSGVLYYYSGSSPYKNSNSAVTKATLPAGANFFSHFFLPNRTTANLDTFAPGQGGQLTEDWISLCNSAGTKCVTLASFSPGALDFAYGPSSNSYFALHGYFAIAPQMAKTISLWIAPYRFDDVINGMTVREWIYQVGGKS